MRWLTGVVLACVLVFGTAPASARTDAWKTHQVRTAGFSVGAPDSWIDVTRLSPQFLAKAKEIPSLRAFIDIAKTSKAIKLILADVGATTVKNHYATNMNVIVVPSAGDLQLLRDVSVAQLKASGVVVGSVASSYVSLPAGKAVQLRYRARYGAASPLVSLLQFILVHGRSSAVITYTTLPSLRSTYAGVFSRSPRSFRFL